MTENTVNAPVYRYYTADLLTNKILEEIPFRGVSYQRAIKGAGSFQGSIPVIDATDNLDLYENTMPGNTAVFVVRDGVCVWGGIIWSRSYNIVDRVLQVSASEFTSYFYHRRIWKTMSSSYSGTVIVNNSLAEITFDEGSSTLARTGSSVLINFSDVESIKYDGYYTVAASPVPTTKKFYLDAPRSVANTAYVTADSGTVTIETDTHHHFNYGDKVTIDIQTMSQFNGTFEITKVDSGTTKSFSYSLSVADYARTPVTGTASRSLPNGVYANSTITTRTDTYDYIRSLIEAVSNDFTGADYQAAYIEPGVRKYVDITSKEINSGVAIIETAQAHNAAIGQSIEITDVDSLFDGEHRISAILSDTSFSYPLGGYVPKTVIAEKNANVTSVAAKKKVATVTTQTAHGFIPGNTVLLTLEQDLGGFSSAFNGEFKITAVPSTTSFQYDIATAGSLPLTTFTRPLATYSSVGYDITRGRVSIDSLDVSITTRASSGTTRTLTTSAAHDIETGDVITVSDLTAAYNGTFTVLSATSGTTTLTYTGTSSLTESSTADSGTLTRKKSYATIYTDTAVPAAVGNSVAVTNANILMDIAEKSYDAAGATATIVTSSAHALQTGDSVDITGLSDVSSIVSKKIEGTGASKTVTLTTENAHNFKKSDSVTVSDLRDVYTVTKKQVSSNVLTVTTATSHNLAIGDTIQVDSIEDSYDISRLKLKNNVATLTIGNHNFRVNDRITVSSLKDTATVVSKELENGIAMLTTDFAHNFLLGQEVVITGVDSTFNGTFKLTNVTDFQIQYEVASRSKVVDAENKYNRALDSAVRRGVADPQSDGDVKKAREELRNLREGKDVNLISTKSSGTVVSSTSVFNGEFRVSSVTSTSVSYAVSGNDVASSAIVAVTRTISKKSADAEACTLTLTSVDSLAVGDSVSVPDSLGTRFAGVYTISSVDVDAKKITYAFDGVTVAEENTSGSLTLKRVVTGDSVFNGEYDVTAVAEKTVSYTTAMAVTARSAATDQCTVTFTSRYPISVNSQVVVAGLPTQYNGTVTVKSYSVSGSTTTIVYDKTGATAEASTSATGTVTQALTNISLTVVPPPVASGDLNPTVSVASVNNGTFTILDTTRNTFWFSQTVSRTVDYVDTTGTASVDSIFNGSNKIITVLSDTSFEYAVAGPKNNVLETGSNERAFVNIDGIFNGTQTVTSIDSNSRTFTYRVLPTRQAAIPVQVLPGYGQAAVSPSAIVSTFGPYPGSADIGIEFSSTGFSGKNVNPATYRGFELKVVGEVLNSYADSIDGFEYRIDCEYSPATNTFRKIFVLIPINFPAAPPPGEISPASRFGADTLVFEYPGNISNVVLNETAENSATRFFALGENDLGPSAGPPFSVDASEQFLNGLGSNRPWPLMDADVKVKNVYDQSSLFTYANRYLTESRPPDGQFTVSVNGSLIPFVGTYSPGDWCSVIVNDKFILQRLANDIELRDTVLIRKIDSIKVTVPDGTTFPESVELVLIPEWEVDKIG